MSRRRTAGRGQGTRQQIAELLERLHRGEPAAGLQAERGFAVTSAERADLAALGEADASRRVAQLHERFAQSLAERDPERAELHMRSRSVRRRPKIIETQIRGEEIAGG